MAWMPGLLPPFVMPAALLFLALLFAFFAVAFLVFLLGFLVALVGFGLDRFQLFVFLFRFSFLVLLKNQKILFLNPIIPSIQMSMLIKMAISHPRIVTMRMR